MTTDLESSSSPSSTSISIPLEPDRGTHCDHRLEISIKPCRRVECSGIRQGRERQVTAVEMSEGRIDKGSEGRMDD